MANMGQAWVGLPIDAFAGRAPGVSSMKSLCQPPRRKPPHHRLEEGEGGADSCPGLA